MRFVAVISTFLLLSSTPLLAATDKILNSQALLALEGKAAQAVPKDQCFLYAELVSSMTDLAGQQLAQGETAQASNTLKEVGQYAQRIHMGVANDSKRLKNAELLMRRTSFRLKEFMDQASYEDRPALEATLKQLDKVQSELMLQVFKH